MAVEWKILMERKTSSSRKFPVYLCQCTVVRPPPTHRSYSVGRIPLLLHQLTEVSTSPTRDTPQCTGTRCSDILQLNHNNPAKSHRSEVSSPLPIMSGVNSINSINSISNINNISNFSNISNINSVNNNNISRHKMEITEDLVPTYDIGSTRQESGRK